MTDELPAGWAEADLRSVVTKLVDGSHNPPARVEPGLPMLSAQNVSNESISFEGARLVAEADFERESSRTRVTTGDVLLTIVGSIGRTAVVPEGLPRFTLQRSVAVMTPQGIEPRFLSHQFRSHEARRYFEVNARGTAQKGIYLNALGKMPIRVAPRNEQQRIISKIDELFSRIDEGERALERVQKLVGRYRQSVLKAAVTGELTREWREKNKDKLESGEALLARILKTRREAWERAELEKMKAKGITPANDHWKQKYEEPSPPDTAELPELPPGWAWSSLDQLSSFVTSGSRGWAQYYSATGSLFLRVGNMQRLAIRCDLADKQFVTPPSTAEGLRTRTKLNDLVISITADVGMSAVIDANIVGSYVNQHLSLVRPVLAVLSSWIAWAVASPIVQSRIRDLKQGATKDGLTLDDVRAIPIPFGPEHEIAEAISMLERLSVQGISASEGAAADIRAAALLRQAVLKSAFSGCLVSQNSHDEPAATLLKRIATECRMDNAAPKRGRNRKTAA